jgi:hypothetical protein
VWKNLVNQQQARAATLELNTMQRKGKKKVVEITLNEVIEDREL